MNDFADFSGQPLAAGDGQAIGIEAKLMEQRGVHVGHIVAVFDRVKTYLVRFSVGDSSLDSAARHPDGEPIRVVIAPVAVLGTRCAAEFARPDDQGFIQKPALFEVFEERPNRLIHLAAEFGMPFLESFVGVPPARAAAAAVINLDKADAVFDQSPRRQHLPAEGLGFLLMEAVLLLRLLGFVGKIDDLRHRHLHAIGQFVGLDPGPNRLIVRILSGGVLVEFLQETELPSLFLHEHAVFGSEIGHAVFGIDLERDAVVLRAEVIRAVGFATAAAIGQRRSHHNELGKVLIQRAQSIRGPGADRGKEPIHTMPARVELKLGSVVAVFSPHRADQTDDHQRIH